VEHLALIGSISVIHLLGVMSPGPDFFILTRNTLQYSKKIGQWTAVGFGIGVFCHVIFSIAGLSLILMQSPFVFKGLKIAVMVYFCYLGLVSFMSKQFHFDKKYHHEKLIISPAKAVQIGFLTNILNPKAGMFFISLFTLVLKPENPNWVVLVLGIIMVASTIVWFSSIAHLLSQDKILRWYEKYFGSINKVFGLILILLGVKLLLS
jgi:threonine/homoserine/homoserine lactone efflux protein